jgi:peroxiredoxin
MIWRALLPVGMTAPGFSMLDTAGQTVVLAEVLTRGPVLLLFYPSLRFAGATQNLEACARATESLVERGMQVYGVSPMDWETQFRLVQRLNLPFPLLYDPHARTAKRYHAVWLPGYLNRQTVYVIEPSGQIALGQRGALRLSAIQDCFPLKAGM